MIIGYWNSKSYRKILGNICIGVDIPNSKNSSDSDGSEVFISLTTSDI